MPPQSLWGHLAVRGVCGRPAKLLATCRAELVITVLLEGVTEADTLPTLSGGRPRGVGLSNTGVGWPVLRQRGTCHHGMGSYSPAGARWRSGVETYYTLQLHRKLHCTALVWHRKYRTSAALGWRPILQWRAVFVSTALISWGHLAVRGVCGRLAQLLATCRAKLVTTDYWKDVWHICCLSGGQPRGEVGMSMGASVWPVLPGRGTCHHGMDGQTRDE